MPCSQGEFTCVLCWRGCGTHKGVKVICREGRNVNSSLGGLKARAPSAGEPTQPGMYVLPVW